METEIEQKLKKPLTKTEQGIIDQLDIRNHPEIVKNPYTQEEFLLQPKAVALYDLIKGCESSIGGGETKLIGLFDKARNIFRKLYPNTYMSLLD